MRGSFPDQKGSRLVATLHAPLTVTQSSGIGSGQKFSRTTSVQTDAPTTADGDTSLKRARDAAWVDADNVGIVQRHNPTAPPTMRAPQAGGSGTTSNGEAVGPATDAAVPANAMAQYALRNTAARKRAREAPPPPLGKSGPRPGHSPDLFYQSPTRDVARPLLSGPLLSSFDRYRRRAMTDETTRTMLSYAQAHPEYQTREFRAVQSELEQRKGQSQPLKNLLATTGVQRNHILADSSIASLLHVSMQTAVTSQDAGDIEAAVAFARAVVDDGSPEAGATADAAAAELNDAYQRFVAGTAAAPSHMQQVQLNHARASLNSAIHRVSTAPANLRFGDGPRNFDIGPSFDPILHEGQPSAHSQRIRRAVEALARANAIPGPLAVAAIMPPVSRDTGGFVVSGSAEGSAVEFGGGKPGAKP